MDAELLLERACAWIALWRADQAYADLHEVLLIDPSCVRAYRVLGQLLIHGGKLSGARDAFRRALSLDPSDEDARNALAAVEARLAEVSRARPEPPRRPSATQLARAADERPPARPHRRFATSPGGPPGSTLTTLVRRAPSAAPLHTAAQPRRRIAAPAPEAVPVARPRDKTAPHRVFARQRTAAPVRPSSPQLPAAAAPAPAAAPAAPGSRAPTVPMARVHTVSTTRTATAPIARAATAPHVRAPGVPTEISPGSDRRTRRDHDE